MKITMYELLGLVKDGKAPKKIKYDYNVYVYDEKYEDYYCEDKGFYLLGKTICDDGWKVSFALNINVEILEEQKKEIKPLTKKDIEALGYACGEIQKCFTNGWNKSLENKPLEEQKKIPKKIKIEGKSITVKGTTFFREKDIEIFQKLSMEINEIIDYLKSKGE